MKNKTLVSIVMAYYNRKDLIVNTLKTIEKSKFKNEIEVIIVDDASEEKHKLDDIVGDFDLDINLIVVDKKDKTWINPSVPYNIGFKAVKSDNVIIQNPECLHLGDITATVVENLRDGVYLSYGCYSVDNPVQMKINGIENTNDYMKDIKNCIPFYDRAVRVDGENGWYNHNTIRPHFLHWCTAITKKDLDAVGGFNEEFANGIAYEDNEFLHRVKKQVDIKFVKGPIVIHQHHGSTNYGQRNLVMRNQMIAQKLMK